MALTQLHPLLPHTETKAHTKGPKQNLSKGVTNRSQVLPELCRLLELLEALLFQGLWEFWNTRGDSGFMTEGQIHVLSK